MWMAKSLSLTADFHQVDIVGVDRQKILLCVCETELEDTSGHGHAREQHQLLCVCEKEPEMVNGHAREQHQLLCQNRKT